MNIQDIINEFIKRVVDKEKIYCQIGRVSNINLSKRTCDVEIIGGVTIYGVRLQSVVGEGKGVVLIPKDGSMVVISFLNSLTGFVTLTSEIEKIHFEAGGEDLKEIFNDIIKEIKNAIIQTPAGTGTVSPATKAFFDLIDLRINKLFF